MEYHQYRHQDSSPKIKKKIFWLLHLLFATDKEIWILLSFTNFTNAEIEHFLIKSVDNSNYLEELLVSSLLHKTFLIFCDMSSLNWLLITKLTYHTVCYWNFFQCLHHEPYQNYVGVGLKFSFYTSLYLLFKKTTLDLQTCLKIQKY